MNLKQANEYLITGTSMLTITKQGTRKNVDSMENCQTGTRLLMWPLIAIWLVAFGMFMLEATAQARRLQHPRMVPTTQRQEKRMKAATSDIGENLVKIARRASKQAQHLMVDIVFVIDGNRDMTREVTVIQKHLVDMAGVFEGEMIDYRFAQTSFQRANSGQTIDVQPFSSDLIGIQEWFRQLKLSLRKANPGYGLDAIVQTLRETNFRSSASKSLLVVGKSPLQTAWTVENATDRIVEEILNGCNENDVHINIIGTGDRIHAQLTGGTGGKWYPISGKSAAHHVKYFDPSDLDKSALKIEGVFRLTAQHIVNTVRQPMDIVFLFDSSRSMETKVDKMCSGIDKMVDLLNAAALDYRFGIIRFWAASGGGESVITLTRPPLSESQIKQFFRLPKHGDEHLLDAVMKGVPKLKTPRARKLVLVVVTDEPTSHRSKKGYTVEKAIAVCRHAGAQVNVIGGTSMGNDAFRNQTDSVAFQQKVTELTNGTYYVMPDSVVGSERH